jgi:hypothetical protein
MCIYLLSSLQDWPFKSGRVWRIDLETALSAALTSKVSVYDRTCGEYLLETAFSAVLTFQVAI